MNLRSADLLRLTLVTAFLPFALAQTSIDGSAPVQLPAGIVGNAYTAKVGNLSGVTYNVELVSGSLPPGLSIVGPELSGVPSSPGTFSFEVLLTNPLHPAPTGPPLLMTCNITIMLPPVPVSVKLSAAGQAEPFAAESIVSAYGTNLASVTASAATIPLPTSLDGNTVTLMDSAGVARLAPLFYVSPAQVNFEIPAGSAKGAATVSIQNQNGTAQSATVTIGSVSPGIFELNGSGLVAAWVVPVISDIQQPLLPVYQLVSGSVVALPISVGSSTEQVYLAVYGTGIRNAKNVIVSVGGVNLPVLFAGAAPVYAGEDQVNIGPLPPALAGAGNVSILLTADGQAANTVFVTIQ